MFTEVVLPLVGQSGIFGLLGWMMYRLHRSAIEAHDKRATEWKATAESQERRADLLQDQLLHLIGAIRKAPAVEP